MSGYCIIQWRFVICVGYVPHEWGYSYACKYTQALGDLRSSYVPEGVVQVGDDYTFGELCTYIRGVQPKSKLQHAGIWPAAARPLSPNSIIHQLRFLAFTFVQGKLGARFKNFVIHFFTFLKLLIRVVSVVELWYSFISDAKPILLHKSGRIKSADVSVDLLPVVSKIRSRVLVWTVRMYDCGCTHHITL